MKNFVLLMLLSLCTAMGMAQERKLAGVLLDGESKEPVMQATIQLLKTDSTFVVGTVSDVNGKFQLVVPKTGKYLMRLSSVGYETIYKKIQTDDDKNIDLGTLTMNTDAVMLKGTTITGQAVKVTLKKDTFVYNAAAFRTPEGSTIEELVKRLPGAEVDDEGKITINGKEVSKILIDGKEFMTGDTKTALKNLPTSIVDKVKSYRQKSDLAKVTGIDDGAEQTVLDFGIKPGMNKGLFSNLDLAYGTEKRYATRGMGAYFDDSYRTMLFANANNTNDMGFPGGGGRGRFGGNRNGLNANKMLGANFNYEKKNKLAADFSVRWNHSDGDMMSKTSSENFVSSVGSFTNSIDSRFTRADQWNVRGRLEWTPDTMTNIMFRPTMRFSKNDNRSYGVSASYKSDPYLFVTDPLAESSFARLATDSLMVNSRQNSSIGYSDSKQVGGMLQVNRKLNNKGRNVTLRAEGNYSTGNSQSFTTSNVHLYLIQNALGQDSTYQTSRYNVTPTKNTNYTLQATYSEPLWRSVFLQLSYKYNYSYSKSERATYDFSNLGDSFFAGLSPIYRGWNNYLSRLAQPYESYLDDKLSRFSEYRNHTHEVELMMRMIRKKYTLNLGMMVQPQTSNFVQTYQGLHTDTSRTVMNFTPTLDFRYRFSDVSELNVNYQASTGQPSMTDLLDITDDSDPLNITKGNPGLKPSFTNSLRLNFNTYIPNHQRAIMSFLNYSTTRNSVSSMVTYDEETGGRTTRPENINGNWNMDGGLMFNTAIDSVGRWTVNTFTNVAYNHYVGYVSLNSMANSQKNITRSLTLGERLGLGYRNNWLEAEVDGSFTYVNSRNKLQSQSNLNTWQFAYGGTININMPWGMSLSSDLHQNSRRGFSDNSMNTNELIWNAQLSQGLLKGKPLTLSVQFYDILGQQSNFSRTINVLQRTDTEYNSINSYVMVHAIYRFNMFGGKQAREEMEKRRNNRGYNSGSNRGGMPLPMGGNKPRMRRY
ncbi:MAG: TonB-dependent receptor [Prevotellaceae bacterium]|nr:TonB-dependent receptor [Prevotellaceae bacterium]MDY3366176.1 TonB-dependent receptor [Prevotella sp.]